LSNTSQLGWVDFSAEDRERVRDVLSGLKEPGTLDELGIGVLRDAFADLMFPGFSTIQTRGKYLITVPRIIRDYLALKPFERKRQTLAAYLKDEEDKVAALLAARHSDDLEKGIIGSTKINRGGVARRPSSVYWGALRRWGIIRTSASLAQFCREVTAPETLLGMSNEEEADDKDALTERHKVHLDTWQADWRETLTLNIAPSEASFLKETILRGPAASIPTQLFEHGLMTQALEEPYKDFPALAAWLGQHSKISTWTRDTLRLAQAFSELIYGAHIRLNCLLAEQNGREGLLKSHSQAWDAWYESIRPAEDSVQAWLAHTQARLPKSTRAFLLAWCDEVRSGALPSRLDALVQQQSWENKRERSIFRKRLPPDYQWFGMDRLGYRWAQVRIILGDIQKGLTC